MPNAEDMKWFKENFHARSRPPRQTPFTLDFLVAIACQETGHIWSVLRRNHSRSMRSSRCASATRSTAPRPQRLSQTKAALLAKPRGEEMFDIARKALEDMAAHIAGFPVSNPNKFCHGYGMFQYDLQFFLEDPDYFLREALREIQRDAGQGVRGTQLRAKKIRLQTSPSLDDMELTAVAIAYNTGGFNPAKGLKQGHFNGTRFYGEEIFDFIRVSRTVPVPGGAPDLVGAAARRRDRAAADAGGGGDGTVLRGRHADQSAARAQRAEGQRAADRQRDRAAAGRAPGARRHRQAGEKLPRSGDQPERRAYPRLRLGGFPQAGAGADRHSGG